MSFPPQEYLARLAKVQGAMAEHGLGALVLSTQTDILYLIGFLTRFWESPTRPWYLVVPSAGLPIAVIPSIGAALMGQTIVKDIRTWSAPDYSDDGVGLLIDALAETARGAPVGTPDGIESHVRMPLSDLRRLTAAVEISSDMQVMRDARQIKTPREVAAIRAACQIAGRAFARVPEFAQAGVPLSDVFRQFQILCLQEGADWVPYLAGGAGRDGYADVISPARETPLCEGDVMMLDTGVIRNGYHCDFDRNWVVGAPNADQARAYARLMEAMGAGEEVLRPGNTAADVFHAMNRFCGHGDSAQSAGRLGHGLGLHLTEGLSFIASDHTVLMPGMVVTLEPGVSVSGGAGLMVHEDDYVITETGFERLSPEPPAELPGLPL